MLIPSPLGLAGSGVFVLLGGSLKVLSHIVKPKFNWSLASDRKEFMELTCAFYNLRSQLETKKIRGHWDRLLAHNFDARLARIVI